MSNTPTNTVDFMARNKLGLGKFSFYRWVKTETDRALLQTSLKIATDAGLLRRADLIHERLIRLSWKENFPVKND